MAFDPELVAAQIALGLIRSEQIPSVAWDALEAGLDGPAIRRLAALNAPTGFEIDEILPAAMKEMGLSAMAVPEAAKRVAKARVRSILNSGDDPLKYTREFETLWIHSGYANEIVDIGTLDDLVIYARTHESPDEIREWVRKTLTAFLQDA